MKKGDGVRLLPGGGYISDSFVIFIVADLLAVYNGPMAT